MATSDRVAIITAGGSGMGADAARTLAREGCRVAILSSSGKGEALAQELGGLGITGSNQSNDDLARLVDATMTRWAASTCSSTAPATARVARCSNSATTTGTAAWTSTS